MPLCFGWICILNLPVFSFEKRTGIAFIHAMPVHFSKENIPNYVQSKYWIEKKLKNKNIHGHIGLLVVCLYSRKVSTAFTLVEKNIYLLSSLFWGLFCPPSLLLMLTQLNFR